MHFLWAVVIGFLVGTIVNRLRPGHDPKHMLVDFGAGATAAVCAFLLGRVIGFRRAFGDSNTGIGLYLSVGITWLLLLTVGLVVSRRRTSDDTAS
jgi:uncharacterized membrane protein YeaQ/YmgE (transglycosylase-associated protein family)